MERYGLFIGGEWMETGATIPVEDKYRGDVWAKVALAGAAEVDAAVRAARQAFAEGPLPAWRRADILRRAAALLLAWRDEIGLAICREVGKPLAEAKMEVEWTVGLFQLCAEEAMRLSGEMVPLDAQPGTEDRLAFALRVPVGVVAAIAPFNYPLNQAAHKVGPAIGAGNAVVLKPSPNTPVSAVYMARALAKAGLPPGWFNLVQGAGDVGQALVEHPGVDFISFTGSARTGLAVKQAAGLRPVTLELGSNSATVVHDDADFERAVSLCAMGAFSNAGQACISVQRVYVQERIYDEFCRRLAAEAERLVVGDPMDPRTQIGPMISVPAAERAEQWVREAVAGGARLLTGGRRQGALFWPTVLAGVKPDMKVSCEEVFAPVVALSPYSTLDEALAMVNDTAYGLQAGIFTQNIGAALAAARQLQVGGVIINDTSLFRRDVLPYGGVKRSGHGREGARYAMEEMTVLRTVVVRA